MENVCSASHEEDLFSRRCVWVNGPVIVGAGPSGLATAACLRRHGVPFVVLERANCIASLWQKRTYDRLKLHLPKQFCKLPNFPFPASFPEYLTKYQFIEYLESYSKHFEIDPRFNESVESARFDEVCGFWRVRAVNSSRRSEVEYICRWLIVATGENTERVMPKIKGMSGFSGKLIHACDYRSGDKFGGEKVLVVGCGNSGMEISLDLCNYNASPLMVVRSSVHVLPREILGKSTFELAVWMMKWLPLRFVDKVLLILAWLVFGNIEKYGLKRPLIGPLELKNTKGKTPVLEIGALEKIRSGEIKVVPEIRSFEGSLVEFVNGEKLHVDSVILATGYRSTVAAWLQETELFSENGFPKAEFPNGWKGKDGLYAVGFTRRGLSGAASDAIRAAQDISKLWKMETNPRRRASRLHLSFKLTLLKWKISLTERGKEMKVE